MSIGVSSIEMRRVRNSTLLECICYIITTINISIMTFVTLFYISHLCQANNICIMTFVTLFYVSQLCQAGFCSYSIIVQCELGLQILVGRIQRASTQSSYFIFKEDNLASGKVKSLTFGNY